MNSLPWNWDPLRSQVRIKEFAIHSAHGAEIGTLRVEYRPNDPDNLPVLRIVQTTEVRR